jgi:hypothetical protein
MLYPKGSQNASTQRIQTTTRSAKVWWVTRTQTMVIRLPTSSTNTQRNETNGDAKPAVTPHRRSAVLVKHSTQRFHWELRRTGESIHKKFLFDIQTSSVARRSQVTHIEEGRNSAFLHTTMEYNQKLCGRCLRWAGSRCFFGRPSDLVEELGRTKPRIVSELMEVANKLADGEDAYNNKRAHSPEGDRASRQRRRSRNEDSHTRRNQIAAGYERRDEEGYESREFQDRSSRGKEKPKYSGPSAEDMLHGPCRIHYAYLDGKRVSNHQMKDCITFLRLQGALDPNQGTRVAPHLWIKVEHLC